MPRPTGELKWAHDPSFAANKTRPGGKSRIGKPLLFGSLRFHRVNAEVLRLSSEVLGVFWSEISLVRKAFCMNRLQFARRWG